MAFNEATIVEMDDLACIGVIKKVNDGKPSKNPDSPYHNICLEIEAQGVGKSGKFYLLYQPEWFTGDFNPRSLNDSVYNMYGRHFAHSKKDSTLKTLANSADDAGWEKIQARFEAAENDGPIDDQVVTEIVRDLLTGAEVGYIASQRVENGELTEQFEIRQFFVPNAEGIEWVTKSANGGRRKKPLKLTWQEN